MKMSSSIHIDVFDDGNEKFKHYENVWVMVKHSSTTRCIIRHRDHPRVIVHISLWKIHISENTLLE
jgi:hypothetical protein